MSPNSTSTKDEIDLLDVIRIVFEKIYGFIKSFFRTIVWLIFFGMKNIVYLLISCIIGIGVGYFFYKSTKPYFSSDLIAESYGINSADMISYINDLSKICNERNEKSLSYLLEIDDSISTEIKNIQAFWIIDVNRDNIGDYVDLRNTFDINDTTRRRLDDRFYLKVEVFNNEIFPKVKKGLINYIKRNPYLQRLNDIKKRELKELIFFTSKELNKLDSLQNIEYFVKDRIPPLQTSQISFFNDKETQLYYRDKLTLVELKQKYEKEHELSYEPITIIKDFTPLTKAENSKIDYMVNYSLSLVMFGFLVLLIRKKYSRLKDYFNKFSF